VSDSAERTEQLSTAGTGEPERAAPLVTRLLFAPVGMAEKRLAPRLSRRVFARIWRVIDSNEPPPRPQERQDSVAKLALALALEGASAAIVGGLLDQAARRRFARLTGRWPSRRAKS
jgi:hypothetical protein